MKIWLRNQWYDSDNDILILKLTPQDKKNLAKMAESCDLYCEYNPAIFDTSMIKKLLTKLKRDDE